MNILRSQLALICVFSMMIVLDTAAAPAASPAVNPNDQTNLEGDRVVFSLKLQGKKIKPDNTEGDVVCIPGDTPLRGLGSVTNDEIRFQIIDKGIKDCSTNVELETDSAILVKDEANTIKNNPYSRFGLTYGSLLIPYKLQLSGKRDVMGGSTIGGYLGRRFAHPGSEFDFVGFIGGTSVPVSQTANGQTSTQNIAGVSYGIGILGTIKDSFHLGFVLGYDHVGTGSGYQYRDLPWIAAEFGFEFSK